MFEVVIDGHAVGVPLGGLSKSPVGSQAGLAMGDAFVIDQAQRRRANEPEVMPGGAQPGICAAMVADGVKVAVAVQRRAQRGRAACAEGQGRDERDSEPSGSRCSHVSRIDSSARTLEK
jgi:hypothetical protein